MDNLATGALIGSENRYRIVKKIGFGGYGVVYEAEDLPTKEHVALKISLGAHKEEMSGNSNAASLSWHLENEFFVLEVMRQEKKAIGFPEVYEIDKHGEHTYLVMEMLGKSVWQYWIENDFSLDIKALLLIVDQMLDRLKDLHGAGYVHGDIRPENILRGRNRYHKTLFLVDFGLATDQPENPDYQKFRSGTLRFMSINRHQGLRPSRRDDLESLCYTIAFLVRKDRLSWDKYQSWDMELEVLKHKQSIKPHEMLKDLPNEFVQFYEYVRALKSGDVPDYDLFKKKFRKLGRSISIRYGYDTPFP